MVAAALAFFAAAIAIALRGVLAVTVVLASLVAVAGRSRGLRGEGRNRAKQ